MLTGSELSGNDDSSLICCRDGAQRCCAPTGEDASARAKTRGGRIAEPGAGRRRQRVDVVLVVKGVEHFDLGHDTETLAEMDWTGDAEVECEESVVFAEMVTAAILAVDKASVGVGGAARRSRRRQSEVICYGLSGVGLHADIGVKAPRQIRDGVEVEFVALVAIGVGILRFEVV